MEKGCHEDECAVEIRHDLLPGQGAEPLLPQGGRVTCGGSDKVSSITATGTITCSTDIQGAGTFTTTTINTVSATAYTFLGTENQITIASSGAQFT